MRIDGVTTPPGLVVAGKTWTLASAADGFWMVHVGWMVPGERQDTRPTPWSRVDADDLTAVAADKRARFVPWQKIRSARIRDRTSDTGGSFPVVHLRGPIVRLRGPVVRRLEFRDSDREAVEVFFEPIADRIS